MAHLCKNETHALYSILVFLSCDNFARQFSQACPRPEYYNEYVKYDVDLIVTGHAHGGQVRIPGLGGLYAPGQGWFPEYSEGICQKNEAKPMIIGRGIGNAVEVPRIFNPPEINTIILRQAD